MRCLLYLSAISVICASASALFVLYSRYALSEFVLEILLETFCSRGKRAINLILFHPTPLCTFSLCALSRVGGFTPGNLPLIQCSRYTYNIRRLFSRFHANPLPAAFVHVTCRRYNNEVDNITRLTCLEFAPADSRFVFLSLSFFLCVRFVTILSPSPSSLSFSFSLHNSPPSFSSLSPIIRSCQKIPSGIPLHE